MTAETEQSIFAKSLSGLIDGIDLWKRSEWEEIVGIEEGVISQWLSDKSIPNPRELFGIFDSVTTSDAADREEVRFFNHVINLPATEVSPHGELMLPTVREYMERLNGSIMRGEYFGRSKIIKE